MKQKGKATTDKLDVVSVEVIITYSNGEKGAMNVLEYFKEKSNLISNSNGFDEWLNSQSKIVVKKRVPSYSFFCEVEDGLMYIKGVNKEMIVGTVDAIRWPKAEKQYAMYLLKNDNDLTEDDKLILNRIIQGDI
jgi:hypothetical protein